ncbi:DoxX family protein [Candidatus Coxiella mudrowiae]|uniref:DoxX family protein n=1 Tax=Candidatus Coxiella mudrowiae TaxID=2054173 RepID=UPI0027D29FC0|nr:DoxX family protein [Candidatus Coxiella mudrowiae]
MADPNFIVTLAGLCELRGTIAIGLGFFTRLGSIGITLYLLLFTSSLPPNRNCFRKTLSSWVYLGQSRWWVGIPCDV